MTVPNEIKLYHIVHSDRLASITKDGFLWCDELIGNGETSGTIIGMNEIKARRLQECQLVSHPGLYVGQCVPFYFCPRSVMLYVIYRANHGKLEYRGGQNAILHLETDLKNVVKWAKNNNLRWAYTLSNAGSNYFEDRSDLKSLKELNWAAIQAEDFREPSVKEGKQAEFLVEKKFPWELISRVGVFSQEYLLRARGIISKLYHRPAIEIMKEWYY